MVKVQKAVLTRSNGKRVKWTYKYDTKAERDANKESRKSRGKYLKSLKKSDNPKVRERAIKQNIWADGTTHEKQKVNRGFKAKALYPVHNPKLQGKFTVKKFENGKSYKKGRAEITVQFNTGGYIIDSYGVPHKIYTDAKGQYIKAMGEEVHA